MSPSTEPTKGRVNINSAGVSKKGLLIAFSVVFATAGVAFIAFGRAAAPDSKPRGIRGEVAIEVLGEKLPAVAQKYNMAPAKLRELFLSDPTLEVDAQDNLLYVEPALDTSTQTGAATDAPATAYTLDQTFQLHSLPSASRKVYLDFDGHTTTNTSWNSLKGIAEIVSSPFDLDGNPSSFSDTERQRIQNIWARVADDYAPYQIDVTTEDPGADALRKTDSNDPNYGMRVIISPSSSWYGSAGGVAYIGSFSWSSDTPCFVFSNLLSNGEKYIAEATSHEVGHTVGLGHDGTSTSTYYSGHGIWAPVMGVGYYVSTSQFSRGEYVGANNTQDDITVIQSHAPLKDDDVGSAYSSARALSVQNGSFSTQGIIERRDDIDIYTLTVSDGQINASVTPTTPLGFITPNLDPQLRLIGNNGAVVTTSNPDGPVAASVSASVTAGTYYLEIDGMGYLDPSTGYSDYASIGAYTLNGTASGVTSTPNQPPVAAISATPTAGFAPLTVSLSSNGSTDPENSSLTYLWDYGNGASSVVANPTTVFNTPGTYKVTLTVKDPQGLSSSASLNITVQQQIAATNFGALSPIVMSKGAFKKQKFAEATVTVVDQNGRPVVGATVSGTWSGLISGSGSALSGADGTVYIRSNNIRKTGSVTFTITNIAPPAGSSLNYVWDGIQRSGSITF